MGMADGSQSKGRGFYPCQHCTYTGWNVSKVAIRTFIKQMLFKIRLKIIQLKISTEKLV